VVSKEARSYIARQIERYDDIKREVRHAEKSVIYSQGRFEGKLIGYLDNTHLQQKVLFVDVFDEVYSTLPEEKKMMIQLLYWNKTKRLNCDGVGLKLHADGSTIGRWRLAVLSQIAERVGLT